jgi:hypothetical protein
MVIPTGDHRMPLKNSFPLCNSHMLEWYFTILKPPLIAHN